MLIDVIVIVVFVGLAIPIFGYGSMLVALLYWTFLEGHKGQSIGKIAMNIKLVKENGKKIDFLESVVQSFGKVFLLPVDLIIG